MNTNLWKKMPLLRVVIPFIIGIFCVLELAWLTSTAAILFLTTLLLGVCIILFYFSGRRTTIWLSVIIIITFFLLGFLRGTLHTQSIRNNALTKDQLSLSEGYMIEVLTSPLEKTKSYKIEALITGKLIGKKLIPHHEKVLLYFSKSVPVDSLHKGDILFSYVPPNRISPPKNPNEFNYQKYLKGLGIQHQFYLRPNEYLTISSNTTYDIKHYFIDFRDQTLTKLNRLGLVGREFSVISALVFGQKEYLDPGLYDAYGAAGATHVLAVSGLHVGLIYVLIIWCCSVMKTKAYGRVVTLILVLSSLWSYAAITGFSPSVQRATMMFTFIAVAGLTKKKTNIFNTIAASAFTLLLIQPNLLLEVGFQLSYSAVIAILIIQPYLYSRISFNSYLADKSWQITTVSIAAQLGTFPIAMLYFHQFPNYFILSNLFVIPLATIILYCTLLLIALIWIEPVAIFLTTILSKLVYFLNSAIVSMEKLPYAKTEGITINITECFLLYALIISLTICFINQKYYLLKWSASILLIISALQCKEIIFQHGNSQLTIHCIHKERAISIFHGKNCYFISSEDLWNDKKKMKFHLRHFWDAMGISNVIHIDLSTKKFEHSSFIMNENILCFKEYTIYLTDNKDIKEARKTYVLMDKTTEQAVEPNSSIIRIIDGKTVNYYSREKSTESNYMRLEYALTLK